MLGTFFIYPAPPATSTDNDGINYYYRIKKEKDRQTDRHSEG